MHQFHWSPLRPTQDLRISQCELSVQKRCMLNAEVIRIFFYSTFKCCYMHGELQSNTNTFQEVEDCLRGKATKFGLM